MKKILLILIITLISIKGNATMPGIPVGVFITYQFTGNTNEYEIKLTKYRDCFGISFPSADTVCISSFSCNYNFNAVLNLQPNSGNEIDPCNMPPGTTTCQGGTAFGVEKYEYSATVVLPLTCNDWLIDYSFMMHLGGLGSGPTYGNVQTSLNNLDYPQNSSPSINNHPCFVGCVQLTNCFNFILSDTNNNSFYFKKILMDTISGFSCPANITGHIPDFFYDSLYIDSLTGMTCVNCPVQSVNYYSTIIWETLNANNISYIKTFFNYNIVANCLTDLQEFSNNYFFRIIPNPTTDFVNIQCSATGKNTEINVFDVFGQMLPLKIMEKEQKEIKIDLRNYNAGIYFVKIFVDNKEEVIKVVKY